MEKKTIRDIVNLVLRALVVAMGVAVVALSCMDALEPKSAVTMLGIGVACAGISLMEKK